MRILVACEYSGKFRRALRSRGHDAISCDLLPTDDGDNQHHYQGDVRDILYDNWEGMVAHPECRYLTNAGVKHLYKDGRKENGRDESRWASMREAAEFFRLLWDAPIPLVAIENPIMHGHGAELVGMRPTQIVQPWHFGHKEMKATGWYLRGLPPLEYTNVVGPPPKDPEERKLWARVHRMGPSELRSKLRSETYSGIAEAGAEQWFTEEQLLATV